MDIAIKRVLNDNKCDAGLPIRTTTVPFSTCRNTRIDSVYDRDHRSEKVNSQGLFIWNVT